MKNILLLAYQCSPYKGSEFSVAWNYITRMSKTNRLFVLYGVSGEHLGDCDEMEQYKKEHPMDNVEFIRVVPNRFTNMLNSLNKKGIFVYSFYLAYHNWHKQVLKEAKNIVKNEHIDVIHYLTPIGYREPGFLWKLGLPYIWGPVGGTINYPLYLSENLSKKEKIKFKVRTAINSFQLKHNKKLRKVLKQTDVFLTATTQDKINFIKYFGNDSLCIPENCISEILSSTPRTLSDILNIAFIGSIDGRKNCKLLIDALRFTKQKNRVKIHIVGEGPERIGLEEYCRANNLAGCVKWHGKVSRAEVFEILKETHLLAITSLCEGNPTTIWEAMSNGIPTITLDHCGMHDTISERGGFKISIEQDYKCIVQDFAKVIDLCIDNPSIIADKSKGALMDAQEFSWDNREMFWNNIYNQAIAKHNSK